MSGKKNNIKVSLQGKFSAEEYQYHHVTEGCDGQWGILHTTNVPYPLGDLGTVLLPLAPFVACPKCQAAYMLPGFHEFLEKSIASQLVVSEKVLSANEIRFLRLIFNLNQKEVIEAIDMESVSYYSKCETGKEPLGSDKQVRLKIFYATKLGINRADDYHTINLTSSRRESSEVNPIQNLQSFIQKEQIEKLANAFSREHNLNDITSKHA